MGNVEELVPVLSYRSQTEHHDRCHCSIGHATKDETVAVPDENPCGFAVTLVLE
jgi:hypothetical protein